MVCAEARVFESPEQAHQALIDVGYLTDKVTATTVYLAAKLHKPLLLEGPAGSGKTEISYAVMHATGSAMERLQCFEGITAEHAIGKFDESLQRLYLDLVARESQPDWKLLAQEITTLDFFLPGPLLKAILATEPCVLLIDELDKVGQEFEATLLEVLSANQISDPRLGTVAGNSIPFTVLTSNEQRRLGDPLRRRSLYLRIDYPTPEREGAIVARRTPEASAYTHRLIAGFAKALRAYRLEKPPSVSEMIDIALAIELLDIRDVTVEHRDVLLPLFAKTTRDRKKLADLKDAFATILYAAKLYAQNTEDHRGNDVLEEAAEERTA
jgi:MoxR-like ATPase